MSCCCELNSLYETYNMGTFYHFHMSVHMEEKWQMQLMLKKWLQCGQHCCCIISNSFWKTTKSTATTQIFPLILFNSFSHSSFYTFSPVVYLLVTHHMSSVPASSSHSPLLTSTVTILPVNAAWPQVLPCNPGLLGLFWTSSHYLNKNLLTSYLSLRYVFDIWQCLFNIPLNHCSSIKHHFLLTAIQSNTESQITAEEQCLTSATITQPRCWVYCCIKLGLTLWAFEGKKGLLKISG